MVNRNCKVSESRVLIPLNHYPWILTTNEQDLIKEVLKRWAHHSFQLKLRARKSSVSGGGGGGGGKSVNVLCGCTRRVWDGSSDKQKTLRERIRPRRSQSEVWPKRVASRIAWQEHGASVPSHYEHICSHARIHLCEHVAINICSSHPPDIPPTAPLHPHLPLDFFFHLHLSFLSTPSRCTNQLYKEHHFLPPSPHHPLSPPPLQTPPPFSGEHDAIIHKQEAHNTA